ncbi:MAG TPA: PIN domain-containing protein [Patescibacteria group bacterium]|nr:PIN domain-containing protein [Patescibacteria group bacterium]
MDSNSSYTSQMKERLRNLQSRFDAILRASKLEGYLNKPNPLAYFSTNPPKGPEIKYRWAKLPPEIEREQNRVLKDFEEWHSEFCRLFQNATKDEEMQLKELYLNMDLWIRYRMVSGMPRSTDEAVALFGETCDQFSKLLDNIEPTGNSDTILVVDTSAIIDCPDISRMTITLNTVGATLIIPSTTISELDHLKSGKRDENFRKRLTAAIRTLNETIAKGNVLEGIPLPNGSILKMLAAEPDFSNLPKWLDPSINDDRILAAAIEMQRKHPHSSVAVLANDINMQNKAKLAGIPTKRVPDLFDDAI